MLLSEDHLAVQDAVRSYVQAEIAPHAAAWDKSHTFPAAQLKGLAALGCYGVAVPTEWDGAGLDYLALAIILEEVAAGCGATSTVVSVNNCPVCSILTNRPADLHELYEEIHRQLNELRATSMTLPNDLVELERKLLAEFPEAPPASS